MKNYRVLIAILGISQMALTATAQEVLPLWQAGSIPYLKKNNLVETEKEAWETKCVFDITNPTLTIYPAKGSSKGKAVLVIPGGGTPDRPPSNRLPSTVHRPPSRACPLLSAILFRHAVHA